MSDIMILVNNWRHAMLCNWGNRHHSGPPIMPLSAFEGTSHRWWLPKWYSLTVRDLTVTVELVHTHTRAHIHMHVRTHTHTCQIEGSDMVPHRVRYYWFNHWFLDFNVDFGLDWLQIRSEHEPFDFSWGQDNGFTRSWSDSEYENERVLAIQR